MQLNRALRYMFLDPTWTERLMYAIGILVGPALVTAFLHQLFDSTLTAGLVVLAAIIQFAGGVFLYYRYYRIARTIALEGRDLPLPEPEPAMDTVERAFRFIGFTIVLAVTMIPLFCVLACAFVLVAGTIGSEGAVIASLIAFALVMLTLGLVAIIYFLVAQTRYLVSEDFGGSLNPGNVIRVFRDNPGGWLLAAIFPVIVSIVISILQSIVTAILPDDDLVATVINNAVSSLPAIYVTLVSFHLAGQAYRLSMSFAARSPQTFYPPQ